MPFIYERPGSPFYWIGFTAKERRCGLTSYSTKSKNKKVAEQELSKARKKAQETSFLDLPDKRGPAVLLFSQAWERYKQDKQNTGQPLKDATKGNYENALNKYFYPAVSDKPINEYTRSDFHKFIEEMNGKSQNTKSIYSKCIFAIFRYLVTEGYLRINPFKRVREENIKFGTRSREDINKLMEAAKETKFYQLCQFQILSGFRIHEVLNLRPIDIKKNIIEVKGKGSKFDHIPIIDEMREFLKTLDMPEDKNERIFKFTKDGIYRFYQRIRTNTGISDFASHDLRKYCISEMANSGVSINFTREYARHSSINTTIKYYISTDKLRMRDEINEKVNFLKVTIDSDNK